MCAGERSVRTRIARNHPGPQEFRERRITRALLPTSRVSPGLVRLSREGLPAHRGIIETLQPSRLEDCCHGTVGLVSSRPCQFASHSIIGPLITMIAW